MRKVLLTCACSMLLLGLWAVNAAAPNFAGTWVLDKGKSELPPQQAQALKSLTWTITQDDKQITVTPKAEMDEAAAAGGGAGGGGGRGGRGGMMGGNQPRTLKLDGSEVVTENPRGKSTTKTKLSDSGLEINTVSSFGDNSITSQEHWTLADGGKTLKVHTSTETPQGKREQNRVFTKQ